MHYSATSNKYTILECGITEPGGREHRYRHNRAPDAWVIGLQLQGSTWRESGGHETVTHAPGIGCSRPGVIYRIATLPPHENSSIYALVKQPDGWEPEGLTETHPGHFNASLAGHPFLPEITDAFRTMYRWTRTFIPNAEMLAVNALERALLLAGTASSKQMDQRDDRLHGITGYIFERMDQPLDVPALAAHADLSPSRFAHLFTRTFGVAPMKYVERVRMEEAKALLASGTAPVNRIAVRVGYESEFYFSRRFKLYTGIAPREYRRNSG